MQINDVRISKLFMHRAFFQSKLIFSTAVSTAVLMRSACGNQRLQLGNVLSNVVSARLILQKLRLDIHWIACLPVCLLNGNSAKLGCTQSLVCNKVNCTAQMLEMNQ